MQLQSCRVAGLNWWSATKNTDVKGSSAAAKQVILREGCDTGVISEVDGQAELCGILDWRKWKGNGS